MQEPLRLLAGRLLVPQESRIVNPSSCGGPLRLPLLALTSRLPTLGDMEKLGNLAIDTAKVPRQKQSLTLVMD